MVQFESSTSTFFLFPLSHRYAEKTRLGQSWVLFSGGLRSGRASGVTMIRRCLESDSVGVDEHVGLS